MIIIIKTLDATHLEMIYFFLSLKNKLKRYLLIFIMFFKIEFGGFYDFTMTFQD